MGVIFPYFWFFDVFFTNRQNNQNTLQITSKMNNKEFSTLHTHYIGACKILCFPKLPSLYSFLFVVHHCWPFLFNLYCHPTMINLCSLSSPNCLKKLFKQKKMIQISNCSNSKKKKKSNKTCGFSNKTKINRYL
jgi:hypothetical protein